MAIKYIVLFVETSRKFITAVINLRGVSTNKTKYQNSLNRLIIRMRSILRDGIYRKHKEYVPLHSWEMDFLFNIT
jgi:hypothetical protein